MRPHGSLRRPIHAAVAELSAFLRQAARRPFIWGEADCILTGADWVREVEGWDPAEGFRRAYRTREEALSLLPDGLASMIGGRLVRDRIEAPGAGDVGVVVVRGIDGPVEVTAICTGSRWAAKSPGGLWIGRAECVAAWRVG